MSSQSNKRALGISKSYFSREDEMTLQLHDLLAKGYFPKELPPPFTTRRFADVVTDPANHKSLTAFATAPRFSQPCIHNLVKTGLMRRNLAIPNPKHFFRLAACVHSNWSNLVSLTSSSPFSLTKPIVGVNRAIDFEHSLADRTARRADIRSTNRYILHADIARFYPSIYTHSIPWAIMTKATAKARHLAKTLAGTWQDELDMLSRGINNNQTIGVPIGPDTSKVLAESLLARIDLELASRAPRLRGIRYLDDYEFAFPSRPEAENALSIFQHLLNEYELAINLHKTAIFELPHQLEQQWASRIRLFDFRSDSASSQRFDLVEYVDIVFELSKRFPDDGVMKYAIARLKGIAIQSENWEFCENFLLLCVSIDPACISHVTEHLRYYRSQRYRINKPKWNECLNRIVSEKTPLGHSSETAWAMWAMKLLNIRAPQQNLWVWFGSGRWPRLWNKASFAMAGVRKP